MRYGATACPTVHHYACRSRLRLSTPGSPSRLAGLDGFFRKYRGRMSDSERARFRTRAWFRFGWEESPPEPVTACPARRASPASAPRPPETSQGRPHLIVGMIADADRIEELRGLLADLRDRGGDPGLSGLDVLVMENRHGRTADGALRSLAARERARGLRVHLIHRTRHLEDATRRLVLDGGASQGRKLSIAHARTALQTYLYAFAKGRPGAVVWIVDDDMRLDPLVVGEGGRLHRRPLDLAPMLKTLREHHAGGEVDIAIGAYSGAPPLPFAATVRVQLVDLAASLQWLGSQDPTAGLPDRSGDNAALRSGRQDYYYDLSRNETDRLETPFWVTPAHPGERVGEAFMRVASGAERILAGEQVFRPLAAAPGPLDLTGDRFQRGGNTFIFDVETLRLAPNPSPAIGGRPSRRSDMLWALLQQRCFGRQVRAVPIALYHDRSRVAADTLDVERIVDDIRGYAMFSAFQDSPRAFTGTDDGGIALTAGGVEDVPGRVHKYVEERLAAFRLSFHRIRGLIRVLRGLMDDPESWWTGDAYRAPVGRLRAFVERLADCYRLEVLERIEHGARALDVRHVREFLDQLPVEIEDHRQRLADSSALMRGLEAERVANAKAVAARLATPAGPLTVLGSGAEAWRSATARTCSRSSTTGIRRVAGRRHRFYARSWEPGPTADASIPFSHFTRPGIRRSWSIRSSRASPTPVAAGPGMVELLAECRRYGVVCRNLHPDNLRVVDGRVRLIDYGSDLIPLESEREYTMMCRRAWLSCRWGGPRGPQGDHAQRAERRRASGARRIRPIPRGGPPSDGPQWVAGGRRARDGRTVRAGARLRLRQRVARGGAGAQGNGGSWLRPRSGSSNALEIAVPRAA